MKISRHKKVHKYLNFFCNNYGFRQPYQILIDGTICFAALKNKLSLKEQLPKYLGGDVKLLTTPCVILETERLGPNLYGAMIIVKQFPVHKCTHQTKPVSGAACLASMLGETNPSRYMIATQDRELQEVARRIPGTPLIYLHQKTPTLEQPSKVSSQVAEINSKTRFLIGQKDEVVLSDLKKRKLDEPESGPQKNKRKKGGPNPLSCKKKKKKSSIATQKPSTSENKPKRKRKRVKIPKHIKEMLLQTSVQS
ncbi:LOW QUALITY PROTEIN: rRNA-processing protein UTP23 homolog [Schistocerca piceifrons]|uniref:LOW QUALITY PROTEIN: rRNA-processing protein UTP23 homolog n=1 Tax=Schistocerca piceifrons TaxID=274613 RepID=UPI001F5F69D2|nr:LOW QUALITY PROTEIN: rRNA-processing protein UTP23 homolog [Schistocerca piceifrons]